MKTLGLCLSRQTDRQMDSLQLFQELNIPDVTRTSPLGPQSVLLNTAPSLKQNSGVVGEIWGQDKQRRRRRERLSPAQEDGNGWKRKTGAGAGDWSCSCPTNQTHSKTKSWIWVQPSPSRPVALSKLWFSCLFWGLLGIFFWFFEMSNSVELQTCGEQFERLFKDFSKAAATCDPELVESPNPELSYQLKPLEICVGADLGILLWLEQLEPPTWAGQGPGFPIPGGTNCWILVNSGAFSPRKSPLNIPAMLRAGSGMFFSPNLTSQMLRLGKMCCSLTESENLWVQESHTLPHL